MEELRAELHEKDEALKAAMERAATSDQLRAEAEADAAKQHTADARLLERLLAEQRERFEGVRPRSPNCGDLRRLVASHSPIHTARLQPGVNTALCLLPACLCSDAPRLMTPLPASLLCAVCSGLAHA